MSGFEANEYVAPQVKVVNVMVEKGFSVSGFSIRRSDSDADDSEIY